MKVTKIKQQVKRSDRYSIFIDHRYSFSLSALELHESKLRVGQDIEKANLNKLNSQVELSKAKYACFKLLSYRPRSTGEIKSYLVRKKYSKKTIANVIKFLTDKKFLNDEEFAKQWVEGRLRTKNSSTRQLKSELRAKQIDNELINNVLQNENINEVASIKNIVEKKRAQIKYQDDQKLMQYLARKGFSYDKILVALGRRTE